MRQIINIHKIINFPTPMPSPSSAEAKEKILVIKHTCHHAVQ